jgi:hypothetical protein
MNQQDQIQDCTESLADLPLTTEQADQTKAGTQLFREQLCGEGKKVVIAF